MFTGDAVNGLINCYKELLDLVKRKKITAKSLCTIDLLQLIAVSMHEGENEHRCHAECPGHVSEGRQSGSLMGWVAQGEAGSSTPAPSPLTSCLLCLPIDNSPARGWLSQQAFPSLLEVSHSDGEHL